MVVDTRQPFSAAHITIIEGDQGSGKSNTGTARVVDAYFKDCVRVFCQDKKIECEVKIYNRKNRTARVRYKGELKLLRIPPEYKLHSPLHIYANFHLYGIPYVYCKSFERILEWLKNGTIIEGILIIDEYYIGGNARECMSKLGRELGKQSFQYRKMQLEVIIITPMAKLIDWIARVIPTEHILCSYDEKTRKVTLTIRKKGVRGTKTVIYDATQYWANFWTNERVLV